MDNKEFKIIKIIDEYNVIINAGANDGILSSSKFIVPVKGQPVIFDGEDYGTLDYIKAELEVKQLYPKMSLCQNSKIIKITKKDAIFGIMGSTNVIEKVAPLEILNEDKDEKFNYITDHRLKIGDIVKFK